MQPVEHQFPGGGKIWLLYGIPHRLDGPACIYSNGTMKWFQHGLLHRLDGPAVISGNSTYRWYKRGKLHRLCGPAVRQPNKFHWYVDDVEHTEEQVRLLAFVNCVQYINEPVV